MSAEFDEIRSKAVRVAKHEMNRPQVELREGILRREGNRFVRVLENRGIAIDQYLHAAGVGRSTLDSSTAHGAEDRMWCGMFIYYCYRHAAGGRSLPFPAGALWSGHRLIRWSRGHQEVRVRDSSSVQPGDIFSVGGHIGMAAGESDAAGNFTTIEGNQSDLANPDNPSIAIRSINRRSCGIIVRI